MRVLMVADGLWNGGAERQMALLAKSLPAGWTCTVASLTDGPYRRVFEEAGVPVSVVPRRFHFDPTPAASLWRLARAYRPDVVHAWGWMSGMAMLPFCRAAGIPLVDGSIRHGALPPRRGAVDRLVVRLADAAVANSRAGLRAYGADGPRGRVIYNGFDDERLAHVSSERGRDGGGAIVVMAARMFPEKDWRLFVRAARVLDGDEAGWRFVALGDGPDRDRVVRDAADLVARGVMSFPKGEIEVLPAIASADIGVLLTDDGRHAEGCSNSLLEYMACGLPVVCTDSGGNGETIVDSVTGRLVAPGSLDDVVSALRSMREAPAAAAAMGVAGRQRLHERFSVERMVSEFVDLYTTVTAG
jgi:glycosyltransferase involved in cell wall biosynthesis